MTLFFRTISFLTALLLAAVTAHGEPINEVPQIQVSGEAEAFVVPEALTIVMGVASIGDTAPKAMAETARIIRQVLNKAAARGVASKDLRTARVNLNDAGRNSSPRKAGGSGRRFRAENLVYVTARDLTKVEALIGELITAGANRVQSLQPVVKPDFGRRQRLRRDAVKNAQRTAEEQATAAGVKLGKNLRLSVSTPGPQMAAVKAAIRAAREPEGNVPELPGDIRVTQQVNVVWEIVQ